ncbi:hypothetical protein B0H10DRAFT_1993151 [Mycena sp. CBHHK59/15]|nr:hypothetical protein B0H10DRAFT_1993151 [Mycena sp. CBHHK59/15]
MDPRNAQPRVRLAELDPVHKKLPLEITSEIFVHCVPHSVFPIPIPSHAPLLLTRVCSDWRSIALNTPNLLASPCRFCSPFHLNWLLLSPPPPPPRPSAASCVP